MQSSTLNLQCFEMTWHGNVFCIGGFPSQKASNANPWCFLCCPWNELENKNWATVKSLIWGAPNPKTLMIIVSSCCCLCPIHWNQVLSREWRCSWSSADRRCSNYIWVINDFIAYLGVSYIRGLMVLDLIWHKTHLMTVIQPSDHFRLVKYTYRWQNTILSCLLRKVPVTYYYYSNSQSHFTWRVFVDHSP